jgi:sigma-B regulation protein RsbU (phosphoserine phosphatase)
LASLLFLSFSAIFLLNYFSFPVGLREFAMVYYTTLNSFSAYLVMRFFLLFPSPSLIDQKAPWLKTVSLAVTLVIWLCVLSVTVALCISFDLFLPMRAALLKIEDVFRIAFLSMFTIGLVSLVLNTVRAKSKDDRRRMVLLLSGTLVGLLPMLAFIAYVSVFESRPSFWWVILVAMTIAIFPLSFVYVVIKHRVLGIRLILRRGLQYALVSRGFLAIEGLLIFLIVFLVAGPAFAELFPEAGTSAVAISTAAVTLLAVAGLREINRRVFPIIDRRFFREAYNAQHLLTDLRRAVRRLADQPGKLLETVADKISDSLYPDQVAIFLRDTQLVPLPFGGERPDRSPVSLEPATTGQFVTHYRRSRSGQGSDRQSALQKYEELGLPSDAFISRYLERFAAEEEPAALEVYLDDPKSWAHALATVDSHADRRQQERALLERLNTRLIVPLVTNDRVLGFISLGEKLSEEPYSKDDKELLLTVAEHTAIALDYAQLIEQVTEQEKLKREIEIAQEVQAHLFPQTLPPLKTLDYSGICKAARGVGGDYYDFLLLDQDKLGIALGDISGKGISAALLMASLQALLRSHAPLRREAVDELISDINRLLCSSTDSSKYGTFFYGLYDDVNRNLTYVNAGHNPPMLFRNSSSGTRQYPAVVQGGTAPDTVAMQRVGDCSMIRLETGGTVIGFFPDAPYQQETVHMFPGDTLLIYSDGVSEAMNAHEEEFGEERLAVLVASNKELSAVALRDLILEKISDFVGEASQYDDLTLVIAKVV